MKVILVINHKFVKLGYVIKYSVQLIDEKVVPPTFHIVCICLDSSSSEIASNRHSWCNLGQWHVPTKSWRIRKYDRLCS